MNLPLHDQTKPPPVSWLLIVIGDFSQEGLGIEIDLS